MKKWIVIALLAISVMFAWGAGWLKTGFKSVESDALSYVPADTLFYMGGDSADKMAEFMNDYPLVVLSPSQSAMLKKLSEMVDENKSEAPKSKFFNYLMSDYQAFNDSSIGALAKFTGISLSGTYAFFSDGLIPVLRIQTASEDMLDTQIENAVANSQWTYSWEEIGDVKARVWRLSSESDELQLYLALAYHEGSVVITLFTSSDSADDKKRRLGVTKPTLSLANIDNTNSSLPVIDVKALKKRYGYTNDMIFFVQFDRLVRALVEPSNNRLGQDLLKYLPGDSLGVYQAEMSEACRMEYTELVDQVPRFVMGYQGVDFEKDSMRYSIHSALEVKDPQVLAELKKVQGYLPVHSKESEGKLMTFGLGINTDALPPALVAFWTQFTEAPFTCDQLKKAQSKVKENNPVMLGMGMAMAEGLKGLGVSLFDISIDETTTMPSSVDFLGSLAVEDPIIFMNMARIVPFLKNINLPDDGSSISIQLPMVPPAIDVKAAIKGKHIVIFSGKKSQLLAQDLETEPVKNNGFISAGFDYRRLVELVNLEQVQGFAAKTESSVATCIQQKEMVHVFQYYNMDVDMRIGMEDEGVATYYRGSIDKPEMIKAILPGEYTVEVMGQGCIWEAIAVDSFKGDGTGFYTEKSFDDSCDLFQSSYSWTHTGLTLEFDGSEKVRDVCTEAFSSPEKHSTTCYLMNITKDGFQCLLDPSTDDAALFRYTRI